MKTQSGIALTLFVSYVAVLLLFGGAIYYFQNKFSYTDFYKRLQARASIAARFKFDTNRISAGALQTLREQHLEKLPREQEYIVAVTDEANLAHIADSLALPMPLLRTIYTDSIGTHKDGNTFFSGLRYTRDTGKWLVIVSADNYYASTHLSFLRNVIWSGIGLIALITIGFSLYFSKYFFAPIRQITKKVTRITTENMHLRLEEQNAGNEIGELVDTFNDLLNRMETAFETQKNFVSNASHEFGTPLTAIIGETEVALIRERTATEYQEVLNNILGQAERLNQITRSLLFLAQTGYGGKNAAPELIRIDEVIWAVKELMDRLTPQNRIYIDLSLLPEDPRKLKVMGNRELLHLAFANLLGNACKYSQNKPVQVSLASSGHEVITIIRDEGIGIPEHDQPFIYDPFFRASNTQRFEGYGIGLPLTRNIIRLHHGTLTVSSKENTGTTVTITLPVAVVKIP